MAIAGRELGMSAIDRQRRDHGYAAKYVAISALEVPPHMDLGLQVCFGFVFLLYCI